MVDNAEKKNVFKVIKSLNKFGECPIGETLLTRIIK